MRFSRWNSARHGIIPGFSEARAQDRSPILHPLPGGELCRCVWLPTDRVPAGSQPLVSSLALDRSAQEANSDVLILGALDPIVLDDNAVSQLISGEPDGDLLAFHVGRIADVGFLPRKLERNLVRRRTICRRGEQTPKKDQLRSRVEEVQ